MIGGRAALAVSVGLIAAVCSTPATAAAKHWRLQRPPMVGGQFGGVLAAVSCATPADCFAVGTFWDLHESDRGLIDHWNGARWSVQSTTSRRHVIGWSGVSCPAAAVCTAVGGPATLWADRLGSKSWQLQHLPAVPGPERWLRAVSCLSGKFCMAVGLSGQLTNSRPLAERWNGRHWSRETVPQPPAGFGGELKGVQCTAPDACIAVGDYGSGVGQGGQKVLAERWNGSRWSVMPTPNPRGDTIELTGISCTSKSWCEAAGDYSHSGQGTFFGLIEHWSGTRWRIEHVAGPAGRADMFEFEAISCRARGSCAAVGDSADKHLRGYVLAEHLAGGVWSAQPTPNPPGLGATLFGVSCVADGACEAVGSQQAGGVYTAPVQFAERFS